LGLRPRDIGYIRLAEQYGIGSADLDAAEIVELSGARTEAEAAAGVPEAVRARIDEGGACSACYANLVSALVTLGEMAVDDTVCVGQAFRGQHGDLGCGNCTSLFDKYIKGCPPSPEDIAKALKKMSNNR
jgi:hypothetical protein